MKSLPYILLIGISTLVACSGNQQTTFPRYADFPETKVLKAQVADLDTILLRYPFRVAVKDSIAIVMDLHGIDYYAHLFQYSSFRYST